MNFLAPLAFIGGLLAIPIILLYMLRLRRREVLISSTFLWRQVLQDNEANTPWQRLRRNLLLILQLIILALLVLALARPYINVPAVSSGQVTVLLDASASMNATDVDGRSRFAVAKDRALEIAETLSAGDHMTVIRVGSIPEVLISTSDSSLRLREAIEDAKPDFVEADWNAALNLAAAGSTAAEDFTMVIISDGGLPETAGLPGIGGELRYIPVGIANDNVAITALATRGDLDEAPELFAQLTNYGDTEARIVFTLFVDGERFATTNETIPANGELPIISTALPATFETLEARLTQSVNAPEPDYLAIDDNAYAVTSEAGERRVLLVTTGNIYIEQVLRSLPGLNIVRTDGATGIPGGYDLYIFDNFVPDLLPDADLFFINPPSGVPGVFALGELSSSTDNPAVVDQADPRMQFVDTRQLNIFRFRPVLNADWADSLIRVDGGSLLLAGESGSRQIAILPFNLRESDLPLQITWPVLVSNMLEWFAPSSILPSGNNLQVGDTVVMRPPLGIDSVRVIPPERDAVTLPVERETVAFTETHTPGLYRLEFDDGEETITQQFAINLFSPLESNIAPVLLADFTITGATVSTEAEEELGQQEYWPWVAALALLVLMIEWYAYHRRLQIPTILRTPRRATT